MAQLPNFRNPSLLRLALSQGKLEDHRRLVFLGKTVLGLMSSAFLYNVYPEMRESELTRRRTALVNEKNLAQFAIALGIGEQMRNYAGVVQEDVYKNTKLLSSAFIAIVGAYFLDSGIEAVHSFVKPLFALVVETVPRSRSKVDSKSLFEQWSLLTFGQNPEYFILQESGSDGIKTFTAGACVDGEVYGVSTAASQRMAEKLAAAVALKKLGLVF